ncbi:MAG TPA: alginate export family protein [Planctomycetota bacterium]|nr:alginate export family protein [Planctomycetota bacterium]
MARPPETAAWVLALAAAAAALGPAPARADDPIVALGLPIPAELALRGVFIDPVRYRHEYRSDRDFDSERNDEENRDLFKLGFGCDARPLEPVRGRVALRLTRSWGRDETRRGSASGSEGSGSPPRPDGAGDAPSRPAIDEFGQDHLDLFEGFVELGPIAGIPLSARVGRQVVALGAERLLGPDEWVQNSRSWDGARVLFRSERADLDLFWGRLVRFRGSNDRNANTPVETVDVLAAWQTARPVEGLAVDAYWLARLDDDTPYASEESEARPLRRLAVHAFGGRAVLDPGPLRLEVEGLYETGARGRDPLEAYGALGLATWRAPALLRPLLEVSAGFAYGSGDRSPRDGRAETLDSFYPSGHGRFGDIDLASWQNVQDARFQASFEAHRFKLREPSPPRPKGAPPPHLFERVQEEQVPPEQALLIEVGLHALWLASARDAWYDAELRPLRRDASGEAGKDLGRELDAVVRFGAFSGGYAHFFPGAFVHRTEAGGARMTGADLFWFQVAMVF